MKSVLLRPKNLCVLLTVLGSATLVLCFLYQNSSIRSRTGAAPVFEMGSAEGILPHNEPDQQQATLKKPQYPSVDAVEQRQDSPNSIRIEASNSPKAKFPYISFNSSNKKSDVCSTKLQKTEVDIDTIATFKELEYSNFDMNYWSKTWEDRFKKLKTDPEAPPLKVIVVPHSHNDPGWLKSFDEYFMQQTVHILNNMLNFLLLHPDFKFVWSEMSLFAKWWKTLDNRPEMKPKVIELIERGQLELLTGGWVMTDEANVNLYSMLDQLIEGHQWIQSHLGNKSLPRNGWSIDPFGHGNAVPYLLRKSGIHNTFIQRTHYGWKRLLGERKQLEFLWETTFKRKVSKPEPIMCHMAPFDLYSIKHACGPDKGACLRFDFRHIHGEYSETRSEPVTERNRDHLAKVLLGQYARLGSLFKHNVALVLLGDDFRFDHSLEWEQQYVNYKKLMDYVNDNNVRFSDAHMTFGTLRDYWNEVYKRQKEFPKLSGDFMPYGDVYSEGLPNYWTGYYTTRPFAKQLSRELQHYLRAAEGIFALGRQLLLSQGHVQLRSRLDADYILLNKARNQLGIFQHHDAITGTSKQDVMRDYTSRLFEGINDAQSVIAHIVQYIQARNKPLYQPLDPNEPQQRPPPFTTYLQFSEKRTTHESLPVRLPLQVIPRQAANIVVYNSHSHAIQDVIRVHVTGPVQKVVGPENVEQVFQLNPVWEYSAEITSDLYELVFIADLAPLSTTAFQVFGQNNGEISKIPAASVKLFLSDTWGNAASPTLSSGHIFNFESSKQEEISLTNANIHAVFSTNTGLLTSINGRPAKMSFGAYKSADFHSGAYLFRPDPVDPKQNITGRFPVTRLVHGPVMSEVIVVYPDTVMQRARIYHTTGVISTGVELETSFDLSVRQDFFELFMTIESDISSGVEFFTDSGGFEMMRRVRNYLLPVEANYYPITEAAFIEDDIARLTLLSNHAHGVTSSKPGHIEIMLERKLRYDDSRGLGEGIMDNRHTKSKFWLLPESLVGKAEIPLLSRNAHTLSTMLNFPPVVLQTSPQASPRELHQQVSFLLAPTACDVHIFSIRSLPSDRAYHEPADRALMVLHNRAPDCRIKSTFGCLDNSKGISFNENLVQLVAETSLTGTDENGKTVPASKIQVPPHELSSFILRLGRKSPEPPKQHLEQFEPLPNSTI